MELKIGCKVIPVLKDRDLELKNGYKVNLGFEVIGIGI